MKTTSVNELQQFHAFIAEKLANGGDHLSPEEVLDDWRDLYPEMGDDVEAIEAGLEDLDNGVAGMPLAEFDQELRRKLKMVD